MSLPGNGEAASGGPPAGGAGLGALLKRLWIPLTLGALVVLGLALSADPRALVRSLRGFDPRLLVPVLGLSLVNYFLRFVRWEVYLGRLDVRLRKAESLAVFLAGFLFSVTPGKAGELGKAWLVRELGGGPALRVVPAVVAERVTDLFGVLMLIAAGALALPAGAGGPALAALLLGGVAVGLLLLAWRTGAEWVFRKMERLPVLGPRVPHLADLYRNLRGLMSPRLLALSLLLSVIAWGAEGAGFYLVVREFAPRAGLLLSVFNYTGSTVVGSLSMLPGGLGAAEGTMTALLHAQGLDTADAGSVTLVTRGATLWFAVLLGLLALPFLAAKLRRRDA